MRRTRVPQGKDREPLKAQRKRARKRSRIIFSILAVLVIGGLYSCVWLPAFRIQHVEAAGPDATSLQADTLASLSGTFDYIYPRDSIFFFAGSEIRSELLAKHPEISAISISRTSFDTIFLQSIPRETAFLWCGPTYGDGSVSDAAAVAAPADTASSDTSSTTDTSDTSGASSTPAPIAAPCYDADSQGFVFATDDQGAGATAGDELHVYGPLASSTTEPLGARIAGSSGITDALEFVKEIRSLGVPIVALAFRGDEADLYAQSGTRITYVLGKEEASAELAASAFPSLNLNDGSLAYVDLRFPGKVYFKKVGADGASADTSSAASQ